MTYTGCGFCSSHECAIRGCQKFKYQQPYVAPTYQWPAPPAQGCICPPTSEQTYQNELCPRKSRASQDAVKPGANL